MKQSDHINYKPIPGVTEGYTALQIYKPNRSLFTRDGRWAAMLGGCGIGHAPTLKEAKAMLIKAAKGRCECYIAEAKQKIAHYEAMLARLDREGLVEAPESSDGRE